MKVVKKSLLISLICLIGICNVYAHPGNTDSKGGHTCRTNCPDWGLNYNEYHYHNGNTYSNSRGQILSKNGTLISDGSSNNSDNSSNSNNTNNGGSSTIYKKSNNANLGSLKIMEKLFQ